ncbi:MAG TPA: alkaline phosphatase family protein [Thermoplasmata archaeon]|nr:alkaline phosphatase family protein [Thermoplasmata archaeon]
MTRSERRFALTVFGTVILVVFSAVLVSVLTKPPPPPPLPIVPAATPIQHIVEIMQENHAFDNYFGTYPGAYGLPPGIALPDGHGGTVSPHWINGTSTPDPPHDRASEIAEYAGGLNDRFVIVANAAGAGLGDAAMGYYDASQIPGYWALASRDVLADHYFAPVLGPTTPNRLYAIAGQGGGVTSDFVLQGSLSFPTIFDQMETKGVSWKYYYTSSFLFPAPPLDFSQIASNPSMTAKIVPLSNLAGDLKTAPLANVTMIDTSNDEAVNEHPPGNVTVGERWVLGILQLLEARPDWNATAMFLTWDESGGYYDHVPPPQVDAYGYGFRVPLLIVSPYARAGWIDHDVLDHTSILKFIAVNWGLPALTAREANASAMFDAFTFPTPSDPPRPSFAADRTPSLGVPGDSRLALGTARPVEVPAALSSEVDPTTRLETRLWPKHSVGPPRRSASCT